MAKHKGDSKKDEPIKPGKPQQDSTQGGDGKHTKPGGKK
jgi:hypothetical protein